MGDEPVRATEGLALMDIWEVFDYRTGETVHTFIRETDAHRYAMSKPYLDYAPCTNYGQWEGR